MKRIVLLDFMKRLRDLGVDLTGCTINRHPDDRTGSYRFIQVVDNRNIQVGYGPGHRQTGHLSRGLLVTGIHLRTERSGKKIVGIHSKNDSIVIQFAEAPSRWR